MHTLNSATHTDTAPAAVAWHTAPWIAIGGVAAALALVAWADTAQETAAGGAPALECHISHPVGSGSATTVMLVNATSDTLPAGTVWAWAPAGGDPQQGEQRVLTQPLGPGGAVRVQSVVPAVALRCRATLMAAPPVAASPQQDFAETRPELTASAAGLSPR